MQMPAKVREMFENEKYFWLATATPDGVPNACTIGAKYIQDDETIVIVDNFLLKTLENIRANPKVALVALSGKVSYQIKGRARYLTDGPEYERARQWMKSKGDKYPAKGAVYVTVEEIYHSTAGPKAGKPLETSEAAG